MDKYKPDTLEEEYKLHKEFAKMHNLEVGSIIAVKNPYSNLLGLEKINSIHPDYGWICNAYSQINIKSIIGKVDEESIRGVLHEKR